MSVVFYLDPFTKQRMVVVKVRDTSSQFYGKYYRFDPSEDTLKNGLLNSSIILGTEKEYSKLQRIFSPTMNEIFTNIE